MLVGLMAPTVMMVVPPWLKLDAKWNFFLIKIPLSGCVWFNIPQGLRTKFLPPDLEVRNIRPATSQCDEDVMISLRIRH